MSGRFLRGPDGRSIVPVGVHYVPVSGPDWPWRVGVEEFDLAFAQMAALGLDSVRIDLLWAAVEPREGEYDEDHLIVLDAVLDAARRHGLQLHPVMLIGGEVGDAVWDVPWRDGRHPHADPGLRAGQAAHVGMLAARWAARGDDVLAWDLTDEPPWWLHKDTRDADARAWTQELAAAIRAAGAAQPITIGTASQEVDWGAFRADVVVGELDFLCVHPYPNYSYELYPDALLAPRMTRAGAFEVALAEGAGKPVMLHEYGASTAQFTPEVIAAYDRLMAFAALGRGAIGFYPWCWADAEPTARGRAPYVRMGHETQFGVVDWRGEVRPRGRVLAQLAAVVRALDLDGRASSGPSARAALIVPHEYVRPYDPKAYGLAEGEAGPYVPAEAAWDPDRDVKPLVRAWLNAYVLAARAGIGVAFPREAVDFVWPEGKTLVLLPAPLTTTTNSLWHVRTGVWAGAAAWVDAGGTLYLSCSGDTAIAELEELAGCRLADRAPARTDDELHFLEAWGPFAPGDTIALPARPDDLHRRGVRLELRAPEVRVVAVDAVGDPALVVRSRGAGHVVVCSLPLELLLADVPDAHGPDDATWGVYAGLADLADARDAAGAEHPALTNGLLTGPEGAVLVLTNHTNRAVTAPLRLPEGARDVEVVGPDGGLSPLAGDGGRAVAVEAYGSVVLTWRCA